MSAKILFWLTGLGLVLLLIPGFNLIGAVLLAVGGATAVERTLGPKTGYKELR